MKWGEFDLHLISDGSVWLDGGAMFGIVPKILWQAKIAPDEKNRIRLALNCLLIQTGEENILIDTGCGHKYSQKQMQIYSVDHPTDIILELRRFGLYPGDIDRVINTHYHFDHCGGNTCLHRGGPIPNFPNATYIVRRQEYEDANHPSERTRASYLPHNWKPLEESGMLHLIDEDQQIVPGVTVIHTPGHTAGHQSVKIESGGRTLFYLGDLCPTSAHVPPAWTLGYDLFPLTTLEMRKKIYAQAMAQEWLLFFEHDTVVPAGYLQQKDGKYVLHPESWQE